MAGLDYEIISTVKFSRCTVPLYGCTDVYNIRNRYISVPAFCCTLHECLLQEASLLASIMVDHPKMEMNDLLNNQGSWLPCYLSVLVGGGERESRSLQQVPGRVEVGRGGWRWWRREGVDLLGDNRQS